jgi:hypothetical protein
MLETNCGGSEDYKDSHYSFSFRYDIIIIIIIIIRCTAALLNVQSPRH